MGSKGKGLSFNSRNFPIPSISNGKKVVLNKLRVGIGWGLGATPLEPLLNPYLFTTDNIKNGWIP